MASFTAAGTAYANYGLPMIPFFIYYSMFGFQRMGDLIWAFADSRGKGFLMGATAGRTTLAGEGLQHQDGHSHLLMSVLPTCAAYDPAYAYEIGVIVQDGLRRMYQEQEDLFYYLTIYNENYAQPPMPQGVREGILKGLYRYQAAGSGTAVAQLFGSGPILNEALKAQQMLAERYQVAADVWSVTSYNELRRDALAIERWNRLHPAEPERRPYRGRSLERGRGPDHRRQRLHEGGGRPDCSMAPGQAGFAWHRRVRPQREPGAPAEVLRGERGGDRRRDALAPVPGREVQLRAGAPSAGGPGNRSRSRQPGAGVEDRGSGICRSLIPELASAARIRARR